MADSPIGLICAIPQELADLRADLEHDDRIRIGGFDFDQGRLDGRPVVLAEAGIGKVNTAPVATLLAPASRRARWCSAASPARSTPSSRSATWSSPSAPCSMTPA